MKFFKHYLIGKVFSLWKGNVRYKKYHRTLQNLSKNLIQTRPAFLGKFMEINKTLYDMQTFKTFIVPKSGKTMDLNDFISEQKASRDTVKTHYIEKVEEINKKLGGLVTSVTES
jgi:uncharacterized protein YaaR (DUF327 family)